MQGQLFSSQFLLHDIAETGAWRQIPAARFAVPEPMPACPALEIVHAN